MPVQSKNLVINFAPTGMVPTRDQTGYVPTTPAEIVEDVRRAWALGITMVHLHARNPETGKPDWNPDLYAEMIAGIRAFAPELIICVSTSGRDFNAFEERSAVLDLDGGLKPDMGSLTLSSLNFNRMASVNTPDMIQMLAKKMQTRGIKPELEAFDAGMINFAHYLVRKGLLSPPHYFNLLMGNIACAQADMLHAGIMVRDLPADSWWSFAGIGDFQRRMNSVAIAMDGGVRVGLEDNIWFDNSRSRLATNADLLERVHVLAEANERPLMPAGAFRRILGLRPGGAGGYGLRDDQDAPDAAS